MAYNINGMLFVIIITLIQKRTTYLLKGLFIVILIINSTVLFGASLPSNPYQHTQFNSFQEQIQAKNTQESPFTEGFQQKKQFNSLLLATDPTAPYANLGDPCPCTIDYPTVDQPGWSGSCADNGGVLIIDPYDSDGLTCSNPWCPCQYYVTGTWNAGQFLGFPIPLNNEYIILFILSLLYSSLLTFRKRVYKRIKE